MMGYVPTCPMYMTFGKVGEMVPLSGGRIGDVSPAT